MTVVLSNHFHRYHCKNILHFDHCTRQTRRDYHEAYRHIILISSQPVFVLTPPIYLLGGEATKCKCYTNVVFGLVPPRIEQAIQQQKWLFKPNWNNYVKPKMWIQWVWSYDRLMYTHIYTTSTYHHQMIMSFSLSNGKWVVLTKRLMKIFSFISCREYVTCDEKMMMFALH